MTRTARGEGRGASSVCVHVRARTRVWGDTENGPQPSPRSPSPDPMSPVIAMRRDLPRCLIPFDRREGLTTAEAAVRAARTERTIRMWCRDHDIGRHVAGGPWLVSRVALAMFLNDDAAALRSYLAGDRAGPAVAPYFLAEGLADLIRN